MGQWRCYVMGALRRQRRLISLEVSSSSVEGAVAAMRVCREQARQRGLRLRVKDDGRLTARMPAGRYSYPPRFSGRFESGDKGVVFEGVIVESRTDASMRQGAAGLGVLFATVSVLLAVAGRASPGSYVCGVTAIAFGLLGYGLNRLRESSFSFDCKELLGKLTPLMPGAKLPGEEIADTKRYLP